MWKVMIADDEPKIRKGLRNSLDWKSLDMEIAGEAEDGEIALEAAKNIQPDILLVDICMPFINGLELVDRLNELLPHCIVIVITGYDEFNYAQQAIKLKVFDYLLKPVIKEQLHLTVKKAGEELAKSISKNKYMKWADQQLKKNLSFLKERFLNELLDGYVTDEEAESQMEFLGQEISCDSGMFIIKIVERQSSDGLLKEWDRQLLLFAIQNIVEELLLDWFPNAVFRDNKDNIIAITPVKQVSEWNCLGQKFAETVEQYLKQSLIVRQVKIKNGLQGIREAYKELLEEMRKEENWTPIVMLSKKYIDINYYKEDLSLKDVADEFKISPAYLSRLLRQELGASFIDYLTGVRIRKAIQLMDDPTIKMYEIAEKVGYNSQHYFSTAFKKILGVSPIEYRKGGGK